MLEIEVKNQDITLKARIIGMGNDILLSITGGELPHIGSVSVSVHRPSLAEPQKTSSTTSTINITGHKDNAVGDRISAYISAVLKRNVVAVCGIHCDNMKPEVIKGVIRLADDLAEKIAYELNLK